MADGDVGHDLRELVSVVTPLLFKVAMRSTRRQENQRSFPVFVILAILTVNEPVGVLTKMANHATVHADTRSTGWTGSAVRSRGL